MTPEEEEAWTRLAAAGELFEHASNDYGKSREIRKVLRERFPDGGLPWGTIDTLAVEFASSPKTVWEIVHAAGYRSLSRLPMCQSSAPEHRSDSCRECQALYRERAARTRAGR